MKYKFYIIASAIWLLPSAIWPSDLKFIHHDEFSRSSNYVRAIYKDSKGFMWFGTEKGAYQFDGYRFYHYKNTPNDSNS
ncbi:MAG: two-component regulator propeller domain-containing protein, partial [bacterium]